MGNEPGSVSVFSVLPYAGHGCETAGPLKAYRLGSQVQPGAHLANSRRSPSPIRKVKPPNSFCQTGRRGAPWPGQR